CRRSPPPRGPAPWPPTGTTSAACAARRRSRRRFRGSRRARSSTTCAATRHRTSPSSRSAPSRCTSAASATGGRLRSVRRTEEVLSTEYSVLSTPPHPRPLSHKGERGANYSSRKEIPVPFHKHTLANGLQIIGETSPSARSVAIGFFVRTGSRDETPEVSGVTHFLEHMIFKGSERRSYLDVHRDFDRIGAHYHAYTSEENTVLYAALLPEYLPQAVDLLADILRPSLRGEDFDMEKNVIIEEIGMYEDQPMWSAYDHAKKAFFAEHPLGNSILGTPESITALRREQMHAYFQRRYVAPNITVVAAGNFDWQALGPLIDRASAPC